MDTVLKLNFSAFRESVSKHALLPEAAEGMQKAMTLLYLVIYSPIRQIGDVDFDSFTLEDGTRAYEQLYHYHPDDVADDEEEDENKDNYLVEVNRVAHAANIAIGLRGIKKMRRFF